ncbi:LVIVD repeat-containing protein [Flavisericum labens]|uniref:LVIVD repeat-containing protein n=1 Tax=Flavisericum labens TaxID=3377112 RepID=UPI00387AD3B4
MKLKYLFLSLLVVMSFSCDTNDEDYEFVQVATPQLMSKTAFRSSVKVDAPQTIENIGKIYAYKDYIFISDEGKGVHVIDNSNPEVPNAVKFIKIPGNEDISVKNDFLYADSATDLVVFDISDINNVTVEGRLEEVFNVYDYAVPLEAEVVDYEKFNYETDIIVGWTITTERRKKVDENVLIDVAMDGGRVLNAAESTTGTGGSLARFQIVENYLYAVGNYEMAIFNIQDLSEPVLANTQYAGWNIETMFQSDGFLYLGSTNGMYIYNLNNPAFPEYVSEFTHWEGCDPVVVDGDYAYLTLRGGNDCGQLESVLEIIDVSDKSKPSLVARHELENPYGLGIKSNTLYVCDGTAGLKLFDKTDPLAVSMLNAYKDIQAKDVIPLEDKLLMIGGNTLYQYSYVENGVELVSSFSL